MKHLNACSPCFSSKKKTQTLCRGCSTNFSTPAEKEGNGIKLKSGRGWGGGGWRDGSHTFPTSPLCSPLHVSISLFCNCRPLHKSERPWTGLEQQRVQGDAHVILITNPNHSQTLWTLCGSRLVWSIILRAVVWILFLLGLILVVGFVFFIVADVPLRVVLHNLRFLHVELGAIKRAD